MSARRKGTVATGARSRAGLLGGVKPGRTPGVTEAPGATSVRTRYWLESRLRANRDSRRRFEKAEPQLDEAQQEAVGQLRDRGIALLPFSRLVADEGLWETLSGDMARFAAKAERKVRSKEPRAQAPTPAGSGR